MTEDVTKLLEAALRLPDSARGALAASLIESLDPEVDDDAEAAWAVEIRRRLDAFDRGDVATVPWAEARRRVVAE